jgi:hypothetical protein
MMITVFLNEYSVWELLLPYSFSYHVFYYDRERKNTSSFASLQ